MYSFYNSFFPSNATSITVLDPDSPSSPLSPSAIISLAIGITVVVGGAVYCGWKCFRAYCGSENSVTPIDLPAPQPQSNKVNLIVVKNKEGTVTRLQRIYADGSQLEIEPCTSLFWTSMAKTLVRLELNFHGNS